MCLVRVSLRLVVASAVVVAAGCHLLVGTEERTVGVATEPDGAPSDAPATSDAPVDAGQDAPEASLDASVAGSGVTGDLLAHSIDTAIWLNGPIVEVSAATETFIKERVHQETGAKAKVTIDDACMFLAEFANGSMGTFESTRYARGRKNFNTFELNGADGSVYFDLEDPNDQER